MLEDEKHLNKNGLHIMLGALKYVLFSLCLKNNHMRENLTLTNREETIMVSNTDCYSISFTSI